MADIAPAVALAAISAVTVGIYAIIASAIVAWDPAYAPLRHRASGWLSGVFARPQPAG